MKRARIARLHHQPHLASSCHGQANAEVGRSSWLEQNGLMSNRTCERGDPLDWSDVPGWVVLLDESINEVAPRQTCSFYSYLTAGGAVHEVTTAHVFDTRGK